MNIDAALLTVPERVIRFLDSRQPEAYCDDCLAAALALRRAQVNMVTSTLGLCQEYSRGAATCITCGRGGKFAIQRQSHTPLTPHKRQ